MTKAARAKKKTMNLGNILEGTWMVKMVKKIKMIGRKKAPGLRKRFVRRR